jgi:ATP-dependent Clp protease protease subunit
MREEINAILEKHTGQPIEKVAKDTERDYYMGPEQAIEYGIIDQILEKRF